MEGANSRLKIYGREIASVRSFLFLFLSVWTVIILVMGWLNFFVPSLVMPDIASTGYLILLSVYIVHKEVNRWSGTKLGVRPGELVVYVWWSSLLLMVLVDFLTGLHVPEGVKIVSFDVLGAFLASEVSKSLNSYAIQRRLRAVQGIGISRPNKNRIK